MSLTDKAYIHWKCVAIIFGILFLFNEHQFAEAEVSLTSPSKTIAENSPLELTCTYTGTKTVQAFYMLLQNLEGALIPDCSIFVKQPDPALYEYSCPTNEQLRWTIKEVKRANEGETWTCKVYLSEGNQNATYTMSVYVPVQSVTMTSPTETVVAVPENTETVFVCITSGGLPAATLRWYNDQNTSGTSDDVEITHYATVTSRKTDDDLVSVTSTLRYSPQKEDNGIKIYCTANNSANTLTSLSKPQLEVKYQTSFSSLFVDGKTGDDNKPSSNTAMIVGVSLGLFSFAVVVYATVVTILWKRETANKEKKPLDKSTSQTTNVNLGYKPNVTEEQCCTSTDNTGDQQGNTEGSDQQYTSLNQSTMDDKSAYDVVQTH